MVGDQYCGVGAGAGAFAFLPWPPPPTLLSPLSPCSIAPPLPTRVVHVTFTQFLAMNGKNQFPNCHFKPGSAGAEGQKVNVPQAVPLGCCGCPQVVQERGWPVQVSIYHLWECIGPGGRERRKLGQLS